MKKKLLLFAILTLVLPACDLFCGDCCNLGPAGKYDITGTVLTALRTDIGRNAMVLGTNESIRSADLRLQIALNTQLTAFRSSGGGSVAYACSPADPEFIEQLDSLAITSRFNFDAQHPAGTSLNDVFASFDWSENLNDYLRQQAGRPSGRLPLLTLRSGPAQAGPQQFRVFYRLTNGEEHTAETVPLLLQP